jgi:hypothetical protein
MPPGEPLAEESLDAFAQARDRALQELKELTEKDTRR